MPILSFNKAEKMKVYVFKSAARSLFEAKKTFEFMFNPESYTLEHATKYSCQQSLGSPSRPAKYVYTEPSKLAVTILIDGTGVLKTGFDQLFSADVNVQEKVNTFLDNVLKPNPSTHEPNFLSVNWGKLNFECRLVSCSVKYTLFDKSGNPLRAELPCTFISDIEAERMKKKANFMSPDLTHQRTVKAGDDLLLLTQEIYGSPSWYIKVAKANQLDDFRAIQPGQTLIFPPIKDLDV